MRLRQGKIGIPKREYPRSYGYEYPYGLDLKPGSDLSNFICEEVLAYAQDGHNVISKRFATWDKLNETLTCFISHDEEELEIERYDPRRPISVVFPESYAILEATLAYLVTTFLGNPIFQFDGQGPEDVVGAALLELAVQLHMEKNRVGLALHTWFRDALSLGVGVAVPTWDIRRGLKSVLQQNPITQTSQKVRVPGITFEGNGLKNIDPYTILPDPSVPLHEAASGLFFGWIEQTNVHNLLREERNSNGEMFNVAYLRDIEQSLGSSVIYGNNDHRGEKTGLRKRETSDPKYSYSPQADRISMYVDLIPVDWGIGDSEYPEKWLFQVVGDSVVVSAQPLEFSYDDFPVAVLVPEYDGYSMAAPSRLELTHGLQVVADFLFNSHVQAVRKNVNNTIVYDPSMINGDDLEMTGLRGGGLIRATKLGMGKRLDHYIHQLQVNDLTRNNIGDLGVVINAMEKVGATSGPFQGQLRQGGPERLTRAEYQGTAGGFTTRLQHLAYIISTQGMQPLAEVFAANTIDFSTEELFVKILGRWTETLAKEYGADTERLKIDPRQLNINYDILVKDVSAPEASMSQMYLKLLELMGKFPPLAQAYDLTRVVDHVLRLGGVKDAESFKAKQRQGGLGVGVAPDDQVAQMAQSGQLRAVPGGR